MFLVTWHNAELSADRYETHELLTDAQERYEQLTQDDDMWSVSIAAVLRSTDYDPVPGMDVIETAAIARENMQ